MKNTINYEKTKVTSFDALDAVQYLLGMISCVSDSLLEEAKAHLKNLNIIVEDDPDFME